MTTAKNKNLKNIADALMTPGKGILAIDESLPTISKRFAAIGVTSTEEQRRAYRELLITAPNINASISGMILFDETMRQKSTEGNLFPQVLAQQGVLPGIKVDTGAKDLAGFPGEKITEGLDDLRGRLTEYSNQGGRFAKWRAVIKIDGDTLPSDTCIKANVHALARYAALCQEAGMVPMVEPEVLMDGEHDIHRCRTVTAHTLKELFLALDAHRVIPEGLVLKTNMVLPGKDCPRQESVQTVASKTLSCLLENVPPAIAGVVFLSGGQSPVLATEHLNAINTIPGNSPWQISFSYGRALQEPCLKEWHGHEDNVPAAQQALLARCRYNSEATLGRYTSAMETGGD